MLSLVLFQPLISPARLCLERWNACNFGRILVDRSIMRKSSLLTLSWTPGLLGSNGDGFEGEEEGREQSRPSGLVTDDAKNLSRRGCCQYIDAGWRSPAVLVLAHSSWGAACVCRRAVPSTALHCSPLNTPALGHIARLLRDQVAKAPWRFSLRPPLRQTLACFVLFIAVEAGRQIITREAGGDRLFHSSNVIWGIASTPKGVQKQQELEESTLLPLRDLSASAPARNRRGATR